MLVHLLIIPFLTAVAAWTPVNDKTEQITASTHGEEPPARHSRRILPKTEEHGLLDLLAMVAGEILEEAPSGSLDDKNSRNAVNIAMNRNADMHINKKTKTNHRDNNRGKGKESDIKNSLGTYL